MVWLHPVNKLVVDVLPGRQSELSMTGDGLVIMRRISLTARHSRTGNTRHFHGSREIAAPASLRVGKYDDDQGYYLFHYDENGVELTDTYHESLAKALAQAEWEFGVTADEWEG